MKNTSRRYVSGWTGGSNVVSAPFQVNDLIEHPPDASQAEAMITGHSGFPSGTLGGLQLQNLLGGAAGNPQLLEQLISSGAFPPPGMLPMDALRYLVT